MAEAQVVMEMVERHGKTHVDFVAGTDGLGAEMRSSLIGKRSPHLSRSHAMQYRFSNQIDIFAMKRNDVANYDRLVQSMQREARLFLEWAQRGMRCPICGGEESELAMVVHGFQYRQCLGCTHVYNVEKISAEQLERFY